MLAIDTDSLNKYAPQLSLIDDQLDILHLICVTPNDYGLGNEFRNVKTVSFISGGKGNFPFKGSLGGRDHLTMICFKNRRFKSFKIHPYLNSNMNINKIVLQNCSFEDNSFMLSSLLDGVSDRRSIDLIYDDRTGAKNDFELVRF